MGRFGALGVAATAALTLLVPALAVGKPTGHVTNPFDTTFVDPVITMEAAQEQKSRTAYWVSSGSITSGSRHTVTASAKFTGGKYYALPSTWSAGDHICIYLQGVNGAGGTETNGYFDSGGWSPNVSMTPYYPFTTGLDTTSISSMTVGDARPHSSGNVLAIVSPGFSGSNTGASAGTAKLTSGGSSLSAILFTVAENDVQYPQIASTASLSGNDIPIVVKSTRTYYRLSHYDVKFDGGGGLVGTYYSFDKVTDVYDYVFNFTITKNLATAAAIDSRRVFGVPNLEGEIPADANAESRNITFNPWLYKGGLFVGYMPDSGKDQSGTARIQLSASSSTASNVKLTLLSLFHKVRPASAALGNAATEIRAFIPDSGDSNYSQSLSTVTWATRWSFPSSGTDVTLAASDAGNEEYANWVMPSACTKVGLGTTTTSGSTAYWRYFASASYQAQFPSDFPANDSQARIWQIVLSSTASWQE